ncbi:glycoside hydrolase family 2 TIM barrel-domain containing protein [Mucilaginibacter sp. HD30]
MSRKILLSITLVFFAGITMAQLPIVASSNKTIRQNLSGTDKDHTVNWDFFCTKGRKSGQWTTIPVPSNWEFQGFGGYNYGHDKQKNDEEGLYKHQFKLGANAQHKRVFIVFEGSMTDTEVKINGQLAGPVHQGAFYRFKYDITGLVKSGDNLLEVKVSKMSADASVNRAERNGDFWIFGGIYRPVYLEIVPESYVDRVAIDAKANGQIRLDVFDKNANASQIIQAEVQTLKGVRVGESFTIKAKGDSITLRAGFKNINTWNPEQPNLYNLVVSIKTGNKVIHQITQRFGFRTVDLRKGDGIYVNDKKVIFKGVCHHSEWPESGRALSKAIDLLDIKQIKEMNMNAVRMSHYPPDQSFLDVCDSLGLFVLDELTGWQAKYDNNVGRKLVKEMMVRDVNHPSIVLWDNGNEGGFNRDLDKDYPLYDPQKRTVIHPWERFNNTDAKHYPVYNYVVNSNLYGSDIFFPTEFMHGLYDGGHGAGLDDFWNLMLSSPHNAGGFLWVYADGAIVRTDKDNILDADGNHAPDGIVGPHREKEASFYTIKEIWSPVYISNSALPQNFDGRLNIENRYLYTNLSQCSFSWKLVSFASPQSKATMPTINSSGTVKAYNLAPGENGYLKLQLPTNWKNSDALLLTVSDAAGKEIVTRSWPIAVTQTIAARFTAGSAATASSLKEENGQIIVTCDAISYYFDTATGYLKKVKGAAGDISLSDGPILAGVSMQFKEISRSVSGNSQVIEPVYSDANFKVKWTFTPGKPVQLQYNYLPRGNADFYGITFNYPEQNITGMKWLGDGPYRVWKNRLKGGTLNVWQKDYNNTITGESWTYPEFKGYHANLYWVTIQNKEHPFTVYTGDEHIYLQMLKPAKPVSAPNDNTSPAFPEGNIGFMTAIPAIGTKFNPATDMGPQSQRNVQLNTTPVSGTLWFDFR